MQDINDIRPPVQVGFDPMLLKYIGMGLLATLACGILFFLIKKYIKKRQQPRDLKYLPAPMPPYDRALKELELLSRQMGHPRFFYFELTAVLRNYIGRSFAINAIEMTSQEFLKGMNRLSFDSAVKKDIAGFVQFTDTIKYAGMVPEKGRPAADLGFVKERIQKIEQDLKALQEENEEAR